MFMISSLRSYHLPDSIHWPTVAKFSAFQLCMLVWPSFEHYIDIDEWVPIAYKATMDSPQFSTQLHLFRYTEPKLFDRRHRYHYYNLCFYLSNLFRVSSDIVQFQFGCSWHTHLACAKKLHFNFFWSFKYYSFSHDTCCGTFIVIQNTSNLLFFLNGDVKRASDAHSCSSAFSTLSKITSRISPAFLHYTKDPYR